MKITTENGIYIQKKDLELIFKSTNNEEIPQSIIAKYKQNINIKDLSFIFFETDPEIKFLNDFWFVVNYNDLIEFDELELADYNFPNLEELRRMRVDHDKDKFLPENKTYDNCWELWIERMNNYNYIPNKNEAQNYPLVFQLLYNKVDDVRELRYLKRGISSLELPGDVVKPVYYTKKQLQQIYYEVLSENLTFEELKPYEKQLYSIFSRMDYTPSILDIISKIMIINRHNDVNFINDEVLDLLMRVEGQKGKFAESASGVIDYLYAIGYNKFENLDSKIVLEKDLKIIKKIIDFISFAKLKDKDIDILSKYNYVLAEIIKTLKTCNYAPYYSRGIREVFLNMATFVYFNPNAINNDFDFLKDAYDYITNNTTEIVKLLGKDVDYVGGHDWHFVENFNKSNGLLLRLYDQKRKRDEKKISGLIEADENFSML